MGFDRLVLGLRMIGSLMGFDRLVLRLRMIGRRCEWDIYWSGFCCKEGILLEW